MIQKGNYQRHGLQPDGSINTDYGPSDTWNPLASAIEPDMDRPTYRNNLNLWLNFDIVKGLSFKITGGAIIANIERRDYYNLNTMGGFSNNGEANIHNSTTERWQNSNILTYDNVFGERHALVATAVLEQVYDRWHGSNTEARQFIVDQLGFNNLAGAQQLTTSSYSGDRSLLSYLGRVYYGYDDRYLATFTYRADGSSVFRSG